MTFSELIQSQEELLQRLLLVSQRQVEIVDRGDPTILVMFLEQRERLWDEFELLEQQIHPHKGIPPEKRVWESAEERQRTELALNRSNKLLQDIMTNDQISFTRAVELKDKVEKDLRRVQVAKTAAPAYMRQSRINSNELGDD